MRIAHLILAHKDPNLVERLVKRLHHKNADVYIQLDSKSDIKDFIHIEDIPNTYFVKERIKTVWANYSLIQATLNGFEAIIDSLKDYTHINLLSGQDYPLRPAEEFIQFLSANRNKSFMRLLSIDNNEWPQGKDRFVKYSFGDYAYPGRYKFQTLVNTIDKKRSIPYNLKPYGGSQWLTITPECAVYAINYIKKYPRAKRFFRQTWCIDEVFFQTILHNSPLRGKLVNDNLRFIEQEGNTRPTIFTLNDAERITAEGKFFARKFDTQVDTKILDYLDTIIRKPTE